MKKIKVLFSLTILFIFLLVPLSIFAEQAPEKIKPGHPQQYTVKKGDTLWDIAGIFLTEAWYWPEVWKANPHVKNPHLIYPGDILKLIYVDGRAYLTRIGKATIRLSPEIKMEELDRAIPTIPLDIIAPYMTKNLILNASEYLQLPYIVGILDQHISAGTNDLIYVMGLPEDDKHTTYGIYRRGDAYHDPSKKKTVLGYEAVYLGEAHVERRGHPATLFIKKSKAEILKGHRIIPINNNKIVNANFHPQASLLQRSGRIIGVLTLGIQPGVTMVGDSDVVIIDVGLEDGIEIGDVFNIYKKGPIVDDPIHANKYVKLPDEINGNLMVFRSFNRLSYALIMGAQSTLKVGDVIQSPYLEHY